MTSLKQSNDQQLTKFRHLGSHSRLGPAYCTTMFLATQASLLPQQQKQQQQQQQ
jgi:hypothetical protein